MDDINIASARERTELLDRIAPALRTDGEPLLRQVAEDIAARRVAKGREKPTTAPMQRAMATPAGSPPLLDPNDPVAVARQLIADRYTLSGQRLIHAWRGDLFAYESGHYQQLDDQATRAALYRYLEGATRRTKNGPESFRPTAAAVNNLADALRAVAHLDSCLAAPAWLDGRATLPAAELIAMTNGLLHFPTRRLLPHSPLLFTTQALPFAYDDDPPQPREWQRFLDRLWPGDPEAIATLQEIFGYIISGDRRQQKQFLIVGPKRAGKDTIATVLRMLVGDQNTAGPTLSSLASAFGLQAMIGKPLAIIGDARLSGRADQTVIAERLLSITGQSLLTIDRKHRDAWTGQLPTRFLILSNELPRLEDASGALASRFIVLSLTQSWYGQEDTTLGERLAKELPSIFGWALDGLERLWERGRFTGPASSSSAVQELEDLGSPIKQFVRERCLVDPVHEIDIGALYDAWRRWSEQHGKTHVGTQQVFGRDLRSAFPGLAVGDRRQGERRWRVYVGIRMAGELI